MIKRLTIMRWLIATVTLVLTIALATGAFAATEPSNIRVYVPYFEKGWVKMDIPPRIVSGSAVVPLRPVAEAALRADLFWDATTKTVYMETHSYTVTVRIGQRTATYKNLRTGTVETRDLGMPVMVISGRTMVPVRTFFDPFPVDVWWNAHSRIIEIHPPTPRAK